MYGNHPFLAIPSWSEASNILSRLASNPDVMEAHRQKVVDWWVAKKAEIRKNLRDTLGM
jgi:hypothetical protein